MFIMTFIILHTDSQFRPCLDYRPGYADGVPLDFKQLAQVDRSQILLYDDGRKRMIVVVKSQFFLIEQTLRKH